MIEGHKMPVTWVLERDVFAEAYTSRMATCLATRGLPHHLVRVSSDHSLEGHVPKVAGPCVVYGSIGVRELAVRHGWKPGVFGEARKFNGEAYASRLGRLFLNWDGEVVPLSHVENLLQTNQREAAFIKPCGDNKEFAGRTFSCAEFADWRSRMLETGYLTNPNFDVLVSTPKRLGREWRTVVVDGAIVSTSLYRQDSERCIKLATADGLQDTVEQALTLYQPAPVYVIDMAEHAGELQIVEYNTFNSADLYACDLDAVIGAVTAYVERSFS